MVSDAGGRRVPLGDALSLADALEEVLSQPELARKMGCQNRAEAENHYAWPVIAARLEDIYRRVLGAQGGAESDLVTMQQIAGYRMQQSGSRPSGTPVATGLHTRKMEAQL
jgi:hypothetical protein